MNSATREAFGNALAELADKNPDVVALDADLAGATKSGAFKKVAPERYFDMGISEGDLMGTAAGMATCGKIPFASTFSVFAAGRAFEQVRNSICYPNLNVKVVGTHAGPSCGEDGATHQAIEDIAIMRSLPNMCVIVPADDVEARSAVLAAAEHVGPVYLRMGRLATPTFHDEDAPFEIGKGEILRKGKDVTIIACGMLVKPAIDAAEELAAAGIDAEVINMATVKPLDEELVLASAKKTGKVITAEEATVLGGLGGAVCELLSEKHPCPVRRIGMMDEFGKSGNGAELMDEYGLNAAHIVEVAKELVG